MQKIHKAKKSLGQNFLKSIPALHKIVEAGEIEKSDTILEIGPGKGVLTEKLLERSDHVIAVEKDNDLFEHLTQKFASEINSGRLTLLNEDILVADLEALPPSRPLGTHSYKIIANIPYNITGAILKKFLTASHQPSKMVLMVQNEVAKRIVAQDGKESVLSISVKAYGVPKFIMKVPARYFSPAPKVDSAIIAITNISRKLFTSIKASPLASLINKERVAIGGLANLAGRPIVFEERFWEIVKLGFAHKRKLLAGNLSGIISKEIIQNLNLEQKRAENLRLDDWISLTKSDIIEK